MEHSKSSSKREVFSDTGLPQETRKITNKQSKLTCKETRKRRTNKAPNQQKEGNDKIRVEINGIQTKTTEKINETKNWVCQQIPYDISYMWNLKYDTNEPIYKTETDS